MSLVDKAIWVIERNSSRELGLEAIAQACGVSRSHLANAFGATAGLSVVKYLRGRRLSEAARSLAGGAPDILTVALDAGYASHEAFTRAFRDRFGVTPEHVRDARSVDGLALVGPLDLVARTPRALDPPRLLRQDALRVVGLAETHTFESAIRIPAQWQRFMPYYDVIAAKADPIPLGVTRAPDDEGRFEYVCAVEVKAIGDVPKELVVFEIAACRYAVFEHRGHVSTIHDTYAAIWNDALPASGLRVADAPILERHHETFDPRTGEGGLSLWIPLADWTNGSNQTEHGMTSTPVRPAPTDANRRTIEGYEVCARDYAAAVDPQPSGAGEAALRHIASALPPGARALEIGSGPGWDADFLEALGVAVDRTDAAAAFRAFQAERGRVVASLDVVEDALPGPYDAVVALCVLQHVERARFDGVLRKIAGALHPRGLFLASMREGEGEDWEHGESGDYRLVLWPAEALPARLVAAGFEVEWEARHRGNGDWLYFVARRR